ncbi:MAG: LamB/YcsF family protein [Micromonosporaceae bacterium]|nr:LamB/YcsF family protein [Micromonosporaceae bacterium]
MDLNADLGEGFGAWRLGDDEALLSLVSSANVACGFHAGDPTIMRRVCGQAAERGVVIGAQVSYRDLPGFGRRRIDYDPAQLRDDVVYQIGALDAFCRIAGTRVRYVKPHGALYNTAMVDEDQAGAVVQSIVDYDRSLPVLCLPGSVLARVATEAGLRVVPEGYADRAYRPDGTLVPRREPGAVLSDVDAVVAQAVRLATAGTVESICVHGDTPGAVEMATRVRDSLVAAGVPLAPFVDRA